MQTITIEIRADFHLETRADCEKLMVETAKEVTQQLLATAALMGTKRAPSASIQCGDMFATVEHIDVTDGRDGH